MIVFLNLKESINFFFILLCIMLFFFCFYLYFCNKRLKQQVIDLEDEQKEILERKIMKENGQDLVSIQNISVEDKMVSNSKNAGCQVKREVKSTLKKKLEYVPTMPKKYPMEVQDTKKKDASLNFASFNHSKESDSQKKDFSRKVAVQLASRKADASFQEQQEFDGKKGDKAFQEVCLDNFIKKVPKAVNYHLDDSSNKVYQKNLLKGHDKTTSPVSISNQEVFDMNKLSFDLNEFIKKSEKIVPKIHQDSKKSDYLKEISEKMANELKPQTIELTDYEKEQEEHAIISYQELLSVKDQVIVDDDDETIDFIEELKHFRNTLH